MAANCWEIIPCDEEMHSGCAHAVADDPCPANCFLAFCNSPRREMVSDPALIFGRQNLPKPAKQDCMTCRHYLENAEPVESNGESGLPSNVSRAGIAYFTVRQSGED